MKINQLQTDFLANISHELKTPISTIQLCSELLRNELPKTPHTETLWNSLQSETKRLKTEVETILELSRNTHQFKHKGHTNKQETISLMQWIKAQQFYWAKIMNGEVIVLPNNEEEIHILSSSQDLQIIFENIISNCKKFSQPHPKLIISIEKNAEIFEIKLKDNGIGFEKKEAKKIFKRFYRLNPRIPGIGIGLHIAYQTAKNLGYELKAESEGSGRGATFILSGQIQQKRGIL